MASLSASRDVVSAAWVTERVHGFGESVLSLVPDGFTTYVRVFHPAYRRVVDEDMPVSWKAIAQANGTRAHAGMQLCALTGSYRFERDAQPGVFDRPPVEGSLPAQLAAVLLPFSHGTPERRTTAGLPSGTGSGP